MLFPSHALDSISSHSSAQSEITSVGGNGVQDVSYSEFIKTLRTKSQQIYSESDSAPLVPQDEQPSISLTERKFERKKGRRILKRTPIHKDDHFGGKMHQSNLLTFVSPSTPLPIDAVGSEVSKSNIICPLPATLLNHQVRGLCNKQTDDVSGQPENREEFKLNLSNECIMTEVDTCVLYPVESYAEHGARLASDYPNLPIRQLLNDMANFCDEVTSKSYSQSLPWTERYAPSSCSTFVYNGSSFNQLERWLKRWQSSTALVKNGQECEVTQRKSKKCNRRGEMQVQYEALDRKKDWDTDTDEDFHINRRTPKRRRTTLNAKRTPSSLNLDPGRCSSGQIKRPFGWRALSPTRPRSDASDDTLSDNEFYDCSLDGEDSCSSTFRNSVPEWRSTAYMLLGPTGVGKTSMVYALANDLKFKVLEINSSVRRSGKDLCDQFQEAMDSHHVAKEHLLESFSTFHMTSLHRSTSSRGKSTKSRQPTNKANFFQPRTRSRSSKKTETGTLKSVLKGAKGLSLSCNSLLLLDEVDVLFENDRGFWTGLNNLLQMGRRPIILTASDPAILNNLPIPVRVCHVKSPDVNLVVPYLRSVCLVEGYMLSAPEAKRMCESVRLQQVESRVYSFDLTETHLDLRRMLTTLQWYASTVAQPAGLFTPQGISRADLDAQLDILDQFPALCPLLVSLSVEEKMSATGMVSPVHECAIQSKNSTTLSGIFDGEENRPDPVPSDGSTVDNGTSRMCLPESSHVLPKVMENLRLACTLQSDLELCCASFSRARISHLLDAPEERATVNNKVTDSLSCPLFRGGNGSINSYGANGTCTTGVNPIMTHLTASVEPFAFVHESLFKQLWPSMLRNWTNHRLFQCEQLVRTELGSDVADTPVLCDKQLNSFHDSPSITRRLVCDLIATQTDALSLRSLSRYNRSALTLDYLPCLRTFASGETIKQVAANKRRFFHYFDRINLYLTPSVRQALAKPVFSNGSC